MNRYAVLYCNGTEARIKSLAITIQGEWTVTVNVTDETITAWEAIKGTTKWFEVYHPNLTKAWFIAAAVPAKLPLSSIDQNGLLTMEISLVVKFYHGLDTKVSASSGGGTT